MESSDPTDIDDIDRRGVDGGEEVVDADNSVTRSIGTVVDAVDPVADENEVLAELGTSGSGSRRTPSQLMQ
jgi:hypothetical protein